MYGCLLEELSVLSGYLCEQFSGFGERTTTFDFDDEDGIKEPSESLYGWRLGPQNPFAEDRTQPLGILVGHTPKRFVVA